MTTFRKARAALVLCAVACLLTIGAPHASADFVFDLFNPTISTSPYVQVDVSASAGNATITFTALSAATLGMMDAHVVDLNVNGTGWSVSSTSGDHPLTNTGAGQADGFGNFDLTFSQPDGSAHPSSTLTINLTGGSWDSNANLVLTPNNDGNLAASHVATSSACTFFVGGNGSGGVGGTGSGCTPEVPEPASMGLLGTALLGAYGLLRRKLS